MAHRSHTQPIADRSSPHAAAQSAQRSRRISTPLLLQRAYADPSSLTATDVKHLQRTVGNRATIGILSKHTGLQAKLKLGPAGDQYEQEADRVAQQVVRQMDRPQPVQRQTPEEEELQMKPLAQTGSALQRKDEPHPKRVFTKPGAGTMRQPKPPAATISHVQRAPKLTLTKSMFVRRQEDEEELQMKSLHGPGGGDVEQSVERQIQTARGGGKPLDDNVRGSMEQGFGADFSAVRVHTGGRADALNRSLNAKAFTVGNDVFFGKGQYNPGSSSGKQLLAHELTHTVQQGAAGVQRQIRNPLVQRYKDLTSGYTLPSKQTQLDNKMFTSHSIDPVAKDSFEEGVEWEYFTDSDPNLISSGDETVVMQKTAREAQEFYATDAVISEAQQKLQDHDSWIDLATSGDSITVGGKTLKGVKAKSKLLEAEKVVGARIEKLKDHICINMANLVMGLQQTERSHSLISQNTNTKDTKKLSITSGGLESSQVTRLAKNLSTSRDDTSQDTLLDQTGKVDLDNVGKEYGTRLGKGELSEQAKTLGINEYAIPDVGEAFATYSIEPVVEGQKKDFSVLVKGDPTIRKFVWGYHYAGVVAQSEDKADKVTLENYNRSSDIVKTIFEKLETDFGEGAKKAFQDIKDRGETGDQSVVKKLYLELMKGLGVSTQEATEKFSAAIKNASREALKAWFFKMYGTTAGSGQTFHEQSSGSGYFGNPMTVRVGAGEGTKYENTKDGKVYGKLKGAIGSIPADHPDVRAMSEFYPIRQKASEEVLKAKDPTDARKIFREQVAGLKAGQMKLHFDYAKNLVKDLKVRDVKDKLPQVQPLDDDGMRKAFDELAQGALTKRGRLAKIKWKRRQKLDDTNKKVLEIKQKVVELQKYYDTLQTT
ncbi:MAG: DUF4157 domain-containing protein [Caldilineaceae bacterium]|nr:DUF4157 domain-containing protein [Caldilineaceae bacterium]